MKAINARVRFITCKVHTIIVCVLIFVSWYAHQLCKYYTATSSAEEGVTFRVTFEELSSVLSVLI